MNYASIKKHDIANGVGVRVSVFVSGCRHRCEGCFNYEAWDFNYGTAFGTPELNEVLEALKPDYIEGLSLLGGEPLEPENQAGLLELVLAVKKAFPHKTIWCYSGFRYEDEIVGMMETNPTLKALMQHIDILVDGRFIMDQKKLMLKFRGSSNQRIIDLNKTRDSKHVELWEGLENEAVLS